MSSIDDQAFQALVAPHFEGLRAHGYRMLGSVEDADVALQETLWRARRARSGFEGRSCLKSWLYRIATNRCLTRIECRPPRVLRLDDASRRAGDAVHVAGARSRTSPRRATSSVRASSSPWSPRSSTSPHAGAPC